MDDDFTTPGAAADATAARRQADPDLLAEANFVAEQLAAVAAGALPVAAFWRVCDGPLVAAALATWGPGSPLAQDLLPLLTARLEDLGWTRTTRGWLPNAGLGQQAGCFAAGGPHGPVPRYLVDTVPNGAPWQRQLVVPPPPDGQS